MGDLFDECGKDLKKFGYETADLGRFGATCSRLFIETDGKSEKLGLCKGHYFIINAPLLSAFSYEHEHLLCAEIKTRLKFLFKENKVKKNGTLLFVGIGNPHVLADSFGSAVIAKILLDPFQEKRYYKISPNTFSNTGINACELVSLIVEAFKIELVMLFDTLATTSTFRLGTSLQITDSGLTPGSALNNFGKPINKSTLGVPCITIGAPLMISAADISKNCSKDLVLAEKDVGQSVESLSSIVAKVVNEIMST